MIYNIYQDFFWNFAETLKVGRSAGPFRIVFNQF